MKAFEKISESGRDFENNECRQIASVSGPDGLCFGGCFGKTVSG